MKTINNYIVEKLHLNKDIKVNKDIIELSNEISYMFGLIDKTKKDNTLLASGHLFIGEIYTWLKKNNVSNVKYYTDKLNDLKNSSNLDEDIKDNYLQETEEVSEYIKYIKQNYSSTILYRLKNVQLRGSENGILYWDPDNNGFYLFAMFVK
jgi:hypothetical protein